MIGCQNSTYILWFKMINMLSWLQKHLWKSPQCGLFKTWIIFVAGRSMILDHSLVKWNCDVKIGNNNYKQLLHVFQIIYKAVVTPLFEVIYNYHKYCFGDPEILYFIIGLLNIVFLVEYDFWQKYKVSVKDTIICAKLLGNPGFFHVF